MGLFSFIKKDKPAALTENVPVNPAAHSLRKTTTSMRQTPPQSPASVRRSAPQPGVAPVTTPTSVDSQRKVFTPNPAVSQVIRAQPSPAKPNISSGTATASTMNEERRVRVSSPGKQLGQVLTRNGVVTSEQIAAALQQQAKTGELIGKILQRQCGVKDKDIAEVLKQQFTITTVNLNPLSPDPALLALLPRKFCEERRLVPFELLGNMLCVAMSNALDAIAKADIKKTTNHQLKIFDANSKDILDTIERWYSQKTLADVKEAAKPSIEAAQYVAPPVSAPATMPSAPAVAAKPAKPVEPATDTIFKPQQYVIPTTLLAIPVSEKYAKSLLKDNQLSPVERWLAAINGGTAIPAQWLPIVA